MKITGFRTHDIRFPTSLTLDGSDAMNGDPDYSCAYLQLLSGDETIGQGLTFTIGRGNELCVAAIEALVPSIIGRDLEEFSQDLGLVTRLVLSDSQLRWLGPEKGVVHLAAAAIVNTVWDALSKEAKMPLWRYVSSLTPEAIVRAVDWTHISDFLSPGQALASLASRFDSRQDRINQLADEGYPAYTTLAGWLGYDDETFLAKLDEAHHKGWRHFKLKVGRNLDEDIHRCRLFRRHLGDDVKLSIDANQVWGVNEAIDWIKALSEFNPYWIEEPTHPDDVVGHRQIARAVHPLKIASGEHAHNQVMFKQLLQERAIHFCQIDACRLAGVNENLAVMLMADHAGIAVCPHAGGVGLCEYVQHLSMIDYVCVSATMEGRVIEHAGTLHHHFENPIQISEGRYLAPTSSGFSVDLKPKSIDEFRFPDGTAWAS